MKQHTKFGTALFIGAAFSAGISYAEIIELPDITRPPGGNVKETVDLENNILNEVVYLVGTITWLPDASGGNVTVAYNIDRTTDPLLRARVGFGSDGGELIRQKTFNGIQDSDGDGPATNIINPTETIDTTPGATTSYTCVMKVIQTKPSPGGDWWFGDTVTPGAQDGACFFFWFNPDLSASEESQPTPYAGWRSGNNNYKSVSFTTDGNTGEITFTDFKIYTAGDTPFDAITVPVNPLAIQTIDYDSGSGELSLTWASNPGENYSVKISEDMIDWSEALNAEAIPADSETTTSATFDLGDANLTGTKAFFRVERL